MEHKRQFSAERLRYGSSAETKKNFRKFKDDREIQTVVTRCLLIENIDYLQQGIETVNSLFDTCCRFDEDYMTNEWSSSTIICKIFLLELKTKITK